MTFFVLFFPASGHLGTTRYCKTRENAKWQIDPVLPSHWERVHRAPKEWRWCRVGKRSSKKVLLESLFLLCTLKVCSWTPNFWPKGGVLIDEWMQPIEQPLASLDGISKVTLQCHCFARKKELVLPWFFCFWKRRGKPPKKKDFWSPPNS